MENAVKMMPEPGGKVWNCTGRINEQPGVCLLFVEMLFLWCGCWFHNIHDRRRGVRHRAFYCIGLSVVRVQRTDSRGQNISGHLRAGTTTLAKKASGLEGGHCVVAIETTELTHWVRRKVGNLVSSPPPAERWEVSPLPPKGGRLMSGGKAFCQRWKTSGCR